jgi:hypothetical protein
MVQLKVPLVGRLKGTESIMGEHLCEMQLEGIPQRGTGLMTSKSREKRARCPEEVEAEGGDSVPKRRCLWHQAQDTLTLLMKPTLVTFFCFLPPRSSSRAKCY